MTRRTHIVLVSSAAVVGVALAFSPRSALAGPSKVQCIEANTKSQDLRRDGKLAEAREQLKRCLDPACPRLVRDDCTRRLDDLEKVQPTLVFDVKDAQGADVIDVRVSVDGRPLVDHLDGSPLNVDPGAHTFTLEVTGQPSIVDPMLVHEGETGRHERVVFDGLHKPPPLAPSALGGLQGGSVPASDQGPASGGLGAQRTIGLVAGVVGAAGLATGAVLGLLANSAFSKAKSACDGTPSACPDAKVSTATPFDNTAKTEANAATVAFIAGGALLATGGVLFLTGPRDDRAGVSVAIGPSVDARSAGLVIGGGFQ